LKLSLFEEGWEHTNHAVILVGYGVDQRSGLKYWLIQNTWGDRWGDRTIEVVAGEYCFGTLMHVWM
jgi:hypothetical protein